MKLSDYTFVLVGKDGTQTILRDDFPSMTPKPWIIHAGKQWGFGVRKTDGRTFYFEVTPGERIEYATIHNTKEGA